MLEDLIFVPSHFSKLDIRFQDPYYALSLGCVHVEILQVESF